MRNLLQKLGVGPTPDLAEKCNSLEDENDFLKNENRRLKKELSENAPVGVMTQRDVIEISRYHEEYIRELSIKNEKLQKDINTIIDSRDKLRSKLMDLIEGRPVRIYDDDDELAKLLNDEVINFVRQSEACGCPDSSEEYKVEEDGYLIHVVRRYKGIPVIAKTYSCICLSRDFAIAQAQYLCELLNEKM